MRLKRYILILFVIYLLTQLARIYSFGVKFASGEGVRINWLVVEESADCLFSKQIWQFKLENCIEYQTGSVISLFGSQDIGTDSEFFGKKRLNIKEIGVNRRGLGSVIAWIGIANRQLSIGRDTLIDSLMGHMSSEGYSLMTDMVFGQILELGSSSNHNLKVTGMLHVVAASGFNISIMTIIANFFSRHFGRFKSFLIWLIIVGGYFLLTDLSLSIIRAFLMMLFKKGSQLIGFRNYHNLYSLAMASFVILLFDPMIMFSISFQLSVFATFGIILFMPLFGVAEPVLESASVTSLVSIIKESFQTTLAAQIFTIPIILYHFSELSLLSFFSNTFLLWLTPLITLGGVFFFVLATISTILPLEPLIKILTLYLYMPNSFFLKSVAFFSQFESFFLTDINFNRVKLILYLVLVLFIYYKLNKHSEKIKKKHSATFSLKFSSIGPSHT